MANNITHNTHTFVRRFACSTAAARCRPGRRRNEQICTPPASKKVLNALCWQGYVRVRESVVYCRWSRSRKCRLVLDKVNTKKRKKMRLRCRYASSTADKSSVSFVYFFFLIHSAVVFRSALRQESGTSC